MSEKEEGTSLGADPARPAGLFVLAMNHTA